MSFTQSSFPPRLFGLLSGQFGSRSISTSNRFSPAVTHCGMDKDVSSFDPSKPVIFKQQFCHLPAIAKWFGLSSSKANSHNLDLSYLAPYSSTIVPLELTRNGVDGASGEQESSFERFEAPLSLLLYHMTSEDRSIALYLAQCSLSDLPTELQADLPTPNLLSNLGRGDIYTSSLWMGLPPTRTPLHRDPNPNLFVQLAGRKVIRLLEPDQGKALYDRSRAGRGHANMRGEEMMKGEEFERLENAVWCGDVQDNEDLRGVEAELDSGDGLFIPLGWWHAVHGVGDGANASANWWFR